MPQPFGVETSSACGRDVIKVFGFLVNMVGDDSPNGELRSPHIPRRRELPYKASFEPGDLIDRKAVPGRGIRGSGDNLDLII